MKGMLGTLGRVYLGLAAIALPAAAATAVFVATGVPAERRERAWDVLRGRERGEAPAEEPPAGVESSRRIAEDLAAREAEVRRSESALQALLARAEEARARAEAERGSAGAEPPIEETALLMEKVALPTALSLARIWSDATVAQVLRALKPARSAAIVDAMAGDPALAARLPAILRVR